MVNLRDNIKTIDEAIANFNDEIRQLRHNIEMKEAEILRLEGSKLVYVGLTEVFGDVIDSKSSCKMDKPKNTLETVPEEKNVHEHEHDSTPHKHCEDPKNSCEEPKELTLEELYKKYRAM